MTTPPFLSPQAHHPTEMSLFEHFEYEHLPEDLQEVSKPFFYLAEAMLIRVEGAKNPPFDVMIALGLQHLLEAKDCFVRAAAKVKREKQHDDAVLTSETLQQLRKEAIVEFAARINRITAENPMGVELPGPDEPFPGLD